MAVIPRYESRLGSLDSSAATPSRQLYVSMPKASPLEGLGQAVQGASAQVGQIFKAQQEREAADYTTKSSAEIQEFVIREMEAAKKQALATNNVEGFSENFLSRYDEVVSKTLEGAPNELGHDALADRMMQARNSLLSQAMSFESSTRIHIYKSNLDRAADNYAKAAAMEPGQLPQLLKQIDGDMAAAAQTLGLADARDLADSYKNKIVGTAASQMMMESPGAAQGLIEQYKDNLSARDYISLSKSANSAMAAHQKAALAAELKANAMLAVQGAITDGLPLNPEDKNNREAVEMFYEQHKQQSPGEDFTKVIERTRIMPKGYSSDLIANITTGSPSQKVQASQQLQVLRERAPYLVENIPSDVKAASDLITTYTNGGVDPKRAVEWAEQETGVQDAAVRERREKEYKKADLGWDSMRRDFTDLFGYVGESKIPEQMKAEAEALARGYYLNGGLDAGKARVNAVRDIEGRWFKSEVAGKTRYMKNAPELRYGIRDVDNVWIKNQFKRELDSSHPDLDYKKTALVPHPVEYGGEVWYEVRHISKRTGELIPLYDAKGEKILFKPDFYSTPEYQELLNQYPGETDEERFQKYLGEVRAKQERSRLLQDVTTAKFRGM